MRIYDNREEPAYRDDAFRPYSNKKISAWWGDKEDKIIQDTISIWQWVWYWEISENIVSSVNEDKAPSFMDAENAYNNIMYFAISRATELGFTKTIRKAQWKICPLCNNKFVESSLPHPFVKRFGIDGLDFFAPCLKDTIFQDTGSNSSTKEQCKKYILSLSGIIQRVPVQGFGENQTDFIGLSYDERLACLKLMKEKPATKRIKSLFGSWLHALVESDILDNNTRKTARGIQTIAKDGHVCLSLGEKTIDDFLFLKNIIHSKEPKYPEGNYRADFEVNGIFIEYFGLSGIQDYDEKTKLKKKLCKKHKIKLISIYPKDLVSIKLLERKIMPALEKGVT